VIFGHRCDLASDCDYQRTMYKIVIMVAVHKTHSVLLFRD